MIGLHFGHQASRSCLIGCRLDLVDESNDFVVLAQPGFVTG